MAACVVACITQSDINLNNNFLCLFPVLFSLPSPSLHVSSDTCSCGATSPTPSPRVNLCCPAPPGLPIYPTYKTCSSEQPVRVQHPQFPSSPVHPTPEIHTTICSLYLINYFHIPNVYSDLWSDTQSVCACACASMLACAEMFECNSKGRCCRAQYPTTTNFKTFIFHDFSLRPLKTSSLYIPPLLPPVFCVPILPEGERDLQHQWQH